jgi:hypothetical protein
MKPTRPRAKRPSKDAFFAGNPHPTKRIKKRA